MDIPLYVVDAFTDKPFQGNPAAVCPLNAWLDDDLMQAIAAENNLSETAFLVTAGDSYELRWFTPKVEVDLCGHATLASAFVLAIINTLTADNSTFPYTNPTVPISFIFGALALMVVLGTLIGMIPAQRAVRIKPIEALREE